MILLMYNIAALIKQPQQAKTTGYPVCTLHDHVVHVCPTLIPNTQRQLNHLGTIMNVARPKGAWDL